MGAAWPRLFGGAVGSSGEMEEPTTRWGGGSLGLIRGSPDPFLRYGPPSEKFAIQSWQAHLDGRPSVVEIDLLQLTSDQPRRDQYMQRRMFGEYPTAIFNVEDALPLPDGFTDGEDVTSQVMRPLNILGIEVALTFDIEARDDGDVIFILGRSSFLWSDFGLDTSTTVVVISVEDEVSVEVLLAVRPVLASPE